MAGRTLGLGRLVERRKIKKGHLLALLVGELRDVRLNEVFFFVDELGRPRSYQIQENTDSLVRDG